jgi:CheY-like chemotaxis protein
MKQQGTGLGLSICRQLVQLWEGEIGVISEEGQGSNFWFTVPLQIATTAEIEQQQNKTLTDDKHLKFSNLHILIAEDVFVNQEVAKTMTENLGCTVEVVENGKEAVYAATHSHFDLILMDIQMPVMNGITATQFIKRASKTPPVIIGLSANAMEDDAKKYIAKGMDDYIAKPVEPVVLQEKLALWFPHKIDKNNSQNSNQNTTQNKQTQNHNQQVESQTTTLLNQTSIDKILSLVKHNKVKFEVLTSSFYADMEALIASAKEAQQQENHKQLVSDIHTIKGVTGTIGTAALYEETKFFYAQLKENNFDKAEKSLQIIESLYQETCKALEAVTKSLH